MQLRLYIKLIAIILLMPVNALTAKKMRPYSSFKVLIDPGHGGKFNGCTSATQKLNEKDIALDIAQRVAKILQEKGIKVTLTRDKDIHLSEELSEDLRYRVDLAKTVKPDLFISIHLNSSDQKNKRGFELYIPHTTSCPTESYMLAAWLHHGMAQEMEANWIGTLGNLNGWDGGIRAAKFFVLRDHACPAVLVELDYLSHHTIERNYQMSSYRQKIAQIVADAIVRSIDYQRIQLKSSK
jgi:N-acetylmuramoyl-L-alanine amidase